jgi:hypothetical protein
MCQQVSVPVFNGGIGLIFAKTIVPTTYLGSWALVAPTIVFKLLVDSHPFFLEAIGVSSLSLVPFQTHLRLS